MTGPDDAGALSAHIKRLAKNVVTDAIPSGAPVAVVDFPYSDNFGDAAIWLGQNALLDDLGHRRRYVCDVGRYDPRDLARIHPDGPILLHGGGNFGDYWPEHQELREAVLRQFPRRQIVQLPQTVGFQDADGITRVGAAMRQHPDFTLLVRDRASLDLGHSMGLNTILCPDSATHLGPLDRVSESRQPVMVLARTDHESGGLRSLVQSSALVGYLTEWEFDPRGRRRWLAGKVPPRVARRLATLPTTARDRWQPVLSRGYDLMAQACVDAAVRQLSRTDLLVTDRLHAHVIATLLGIPNIVVDNSYGKVRGIYEEFTHTSNVATMVDSADEAVEHVTAILSQRSSSV